MPTTGSLIAVSKVLDGQAGIRCSLIILALGEAETGSSLCLVEQPA